MKDKELLFIAHKIATALIFPRKAQYMWYAGRFANIPQSSVPRGR